MFKIKVVTLDYYLSKPVHGLDNLQCEFRCSPVGKLPIVRVFGIDETGEKVCAHIHGVFPYIYIPNCIGEDTNSFTYRFANSLDKSINVRLGQAASNQQHVYNIETVSAIPMYGYYAKEQNFFKISFYNPQIVKKAVELLENNHVMGQRFQPHESHIPFHQQFMIDYNIQGMNYITMSGIHLRDDKTCKTRCKIEYDAHCNSILNRLQHSAKLTNPGIEFIRNDEKQRRRNNEESSFLATCLTQNRNDSTPTDSHERFKNMLSRQLRENLSHDSNSTLSLSMDESVCEHAEFLYEILQENLDVEKDSILSQRINFDDDDDDETEDFNKTLIEIPQVDGACEVRSLRSRTRGHEYELSTLKTRNKEYHYRSLRGMWVLLTDISKQKRYKRYFRKFEKSNNVVSEVTSPASYDSKIKLPMLKPKEQTTQTIVKRERKLRNRKNFISSKRMEKMIKDYNLTKQIENAMERGIQPRFKCVNAKRPKSPKRKRKVLVFDLSRMPTFTIQPNIYKAKYPNTTWHFEDCIVSTKSSINTTETTNERCLNELLAIIEELEKAEANPKTNIARTASPFDWGEFLAGFNAQHMETQQEIASTCIAQKLVDQCISNVFSTKIPQIDGVNDSSDEEGGKQVERCYEPLNVNVVESPIINKRLIKRPTKSIKRKRTLISEGEPGVDKSLVVCRYKSKQSHDSDVLITSQASKEASQVAITSQFDLKQQTGVESRYDLAIPLTSKSDLAQPSSDDIESTSNPSDDCFTSSKQNISQVPACDFPVTSKKDLTQQSSQNIQLGAGSDLIQTKRDYDLTLTSSPKHNKISQESTIVISASSSSNELPTSKRAPNELTSDSDSMFLSKDSIDQKSNIDLLTRNLAGPSTSKHGLIQPTSQEMKSQSSQNLTLSSTSTSTSSTSQDSNRPIMDNDLILSSTSSKDAINRKSNVELLRDNLVCPTTSKLTSQDTQLDTTSMLDLTLSISDDDLILSSVAKSSHKVTLPSSSTSRSSTSKCVSNRPISDNDILLASTSSKHAINEKSNIDLSRDNLIDPTTSKHGLSKQASQDITLETISKLYLTLSASDDDLMLSSVPKPSHKLTLPSTSISKDILKQPMNNSDSILPSSSKHTINQKSNVNLLSQNLARPSTSKQASQDMTIGGTSKSQSSHGDDLSLRSTSQSSGNLTLPSTSTIDNLVLYESDGDLFSPHDVTLTDEFNSTRYNLLKQHADELEIIEGCDDGCKVSNSDDYVLTTCKYKPPSRSLIASTAIKYGVPLQRNQGAYYSNYKDVTGCVEVGFNTLKIGSKTIQDVTEFKPLFGGGIKSIQAGLLQDLKLCDIQSVIYKKAKYVIVEPIKKAPRISHDYPTTQLTNNNNSTFDSTFGKTLEINPRIDNMQDVKCVLEHQFVTSFILEVHVNTRENLRPNPEVDAICAIFYTQFEAVANGRQAVKTGTIIFNNPTLAAAEECDAIIHVDTELDLFNKFLELFHENNPDILLGYEIEMSSWGYLIQRGTALNLNIRNELSRILHDDDKRNDFMQSEQITGRIVLDLWRLLRHELALQSYTFENIAYHVLKERVSMHSYAELTRWWNDERVKIKSLTLAYYLKRVRSIVRIIDHFDLIGRTTELARLFGILFYEVMSRGSQFRVESMMLRQAKSLNFIAVSPNLQQRAKMRSPEFLPLILEPESKFYKDPVIVLDFQSLYPSIIIAYNYCFTTCVGRVEHLGTNKTFEFGATQYQIPRSRIQRLLDKDQLNFAPCGVGFVNKTVRHGILPRLLEEILNTRLLVKQSLKRFKENKMLKRVLHSRQLGLKLIANVTYGYTAANFSGRMPAVEVADSVVSKGRETLQRAITLVESNREWGVRVVYGDTDSIFVLVPGRSRQEAFRIGEEIAEAVTNDNPSPVRLKLEKVYQPCILQTKKRYVGYMYESAEQAEAEYEAKGIETVRRDGCPIVAKMLEKCLRLLFETRDVSLIRKYVTKQFHKIITGNLSMQDLTFAKEFRGLHGYKKGACVPALELTKKWMLSDPRNVPRNGERVPYVVINGHPSLPLIKLVRSPRDLLDDPALKPNALYYITKVVIPPINRCMLLLGADLNTWFTDMPKKQSLNSYASTSPGKKSTISQYFQSSHCLCCGEMSVDGLCSQCKNKKQDSLILIYEKIRKLERTYHETNLICQSCCNTKLETNCISLDCPVLYSVNRKFRNLQQIEYCKGIISNIF